MPSNLVRKIVRAVCRWRIYVGRDPQGLTAPALVLFPLLRETLCCGLAGILTLHRPAVAPAGEDLTALFGKARQRNLAALLGGAIPLADFLGGEASLAAMERELLRLKTEEAFGRIFFEPDRAERLTRLGEGMRAFLAAEESLLERETVALSTADLEVVNRGLVTLRDLAWGLERDILDNVRKIVGLAGVAAVGQLAPEALAKYRKINGLLNSLDRLEVRGRDSAGLSLAFVPADAGSVADLLSELRRRGHGEELCRRMAAGDLIDGSIQFAERAAPGRAGNGNGAICFTYKTASIIGELGRNVRELRSRIARDPLLQAFAALPTLSVTAFAHTRWASVGSISEENCHPIGSFTLSRTLPGAAAGEKDYPAYGRGPWSIQVVLNGDIDNYQALREAVEAQGERIAPAVTTDTKIIPLEIERHLLAGHDLQEAFRLAVNGFEGSHAIAMLSNLEPQKAYLALRGSGQSIYVGIAPDRYLFSSELYGLVEETPYFIKMDGEKPSRPERPEANGQIFVLAQDSAGGGEGIAGFCYDGTPLPLSAAAIRKAEITTRDIDRGDYPHFFLKEIVESVHSVRKTLRGRYRIEGRGGSERVVFNLGEDVVPARIRAALLNGGIRRIAVIGHGTAAVAASAVADALGRALKGSAIAIEAKIASELSGFGLEGDLSDLLLIPITQSGTTTDTNRAVAMAAERGAAVIAIVNRRQSDITTKSDGVFYTSDGRDIEMAVASTKAFYSQIVAGQILALSLAWWLGTLPDGRIAAELRQLEGAPELMRRVLAQKETIRAAVERLAKGKRYWAVVGSGPNKAAADEIRIKLSELCYQTISSDVVENKKHIDLSAEPLILVCAAGSPESVAGDIVKDVAIFKAHKSAVIVFADEEERRFDSIADAVIPIPKAPLPLPVILNTVAGHLFGYLAACSIDGDALFLREFKGRLNQLMVDQARRGMSPYERTADGRLRQLSVEMGEQFRRRRQDGACGQMGVGTVSDLVLLLKYTAGKLPADDFRRDFPAAAALSPLDLLDVTLGHAVDELSRPIDAIRHQAKTVTVGTSRKETPQGLLFDLLARLGFAEKALLNSNLLLLGRLQRAVAAVNGHTLYGLEGLDGEGRPGEGTTIRIVQRGGVSLTMPSRVAQPGVLKGTKKGIVATGRAYVGRGKSDGAPIVILPLLGEGDRVGHLLLVHVTFNEALPLRERREILGGRVEGIRDLVQEYDLPWDDGCLAEIPLGLLLGEPVEVIAAGIRESLLRAQGECGTSAKG